MRPTILTGKAIRHDVERGISRMRRCRSAKEDGIASSVRSSPRRPEQNATMRLNNRVERHEVLASSPLRTSRETSTSRGSSSAHGSQQPARTSSALIY